MKIIGLVRFSFMAEPSSREWKNRFSRVEEQQGFLFARERMAQRFHFFEHLTLASFAAQTDQDFTVLVLASEAMPGDMRARLDALAGPLPNVEVIYRPPGNVNAILTGEVAQRAPDPAERVVQFRIDDDDALNHHFVAQLRRDAEAIPVQANGLGLSYSNGVTLVVESGEVTHFETCAPFIGLGLAMATRGAPGFNLYGLAHRNIPRRMPVYINNRRNMYVRLLHGGNDTKDWMTYQKRTFVRELDAESIARIVPRNFRWTTPAGLTRMLLAPPLEIGAKTPAQAGGSV